MQERGKILEQSWLGPCQDLAMVFIAMVRSYQESHVPKKNFIVKSYLARKNLEGSQQKSTSLQLYIVRHEKFLLAIYKT